MRSFRLTAVKPCAEYCPTAEPLSLTTSDTYRTTRSRAKQYRSSGTLSRRHPRGLVGIGSDETCLEKRVNYLALDRRSTDYQSARVHGAAEMFSTTSVYFASHAVGEVRRIDFRAGRSKDRIDEADRKESTCLCSCAVFCFSSVVRHSGCSQSLSRVSVRLLAG